MLKPILMILAALSAVAALFFGLVPLVGYRIFHVGVLLLLLYGIGVLLLLLFWDAFPDPLYPGYPRESERWWQILRRVLAALLALMLLAGAVLSAVMARAAWGNPPPEEAQVTLVVLGCQVRDGRPSRMLRGRLDAALAWLEEHPGAPVVVSGGQGPDEAVSEAAAMTEYLLERGIPGESIYREDRSTGTRENLEYSARLIREEGLPEAAAVVTDGFHQLRGQIYAGRAGLSPVYGIPSQGPWGLAPGYWVREFAGIAKAVLLEEGRK